EIEVQAQWFGGEYGRRFTGVDGEAIEIVQFGHWNRAAGPDFTECAVRINGELRAGAIEIDLDSRDWERHGHGANPDFDEVVLHVFCDGPALARVFTPTSRFREVPQLQLPQFSEPPGPADFLPEARAGRCLAPLAEMSDLGINAILKSASQHRLNRKSRRFAMMSQTTTYDQALFQSIAEGLGFHQNKVPMAILAQRCRLDHLLGLTDAVREAQLFGAAGFLNPHSLKDTQSPRASAYQRELWDTWWTIRDRVEPHPHRLPNWRLTGSRPLNHPHRRVAALLGIVNNWGKICDFGVNPVKNSTEIVNKFRETLSHPFWNRHYTLRSKPASKPQALVGKDRVVDLLGNVIVPSQPSNFEKSWDVYESLPAVTDNSKLRRARLRLFGADKSDRTRKFQRRYFQQQGLLQIYEDFCRVDLSECTDCPFPEQLGQWQPGVPAREIRADANLDKQEQL
ncbi:MAG: DUF2851 family protein, partial [Verrucomicrobiota bacterium]